MKLYRKLIRPMHCFPGQYYEPRKEPIEKEEIWYPEEKRNELYERYSQYDKGSFNDLVFDEKYEEVEIIDCKDCEHCKIYANGWNSECRDGHNISYVNGYCSEAMPNLRQVMQNE